MYSNIYGQCIHFNWRNFRKWRAQFTKIKSVKKSFWTASTRIIFREKNVWSFAENKFLQKKFFYISQKNYSTCLHSSNNQLKRKIWESNICTFIYIFELKLIMDVLISMNLFKLVYREINTLKKIFFLQPINFAERLHMRKYYTTKNLFHYCTKHFLTTQTMKDWTIVSEQQSKRLGPPICKIIVFACRVTPHTLYRDS